jgi:hypothetical protein
LWVACYARGQPGSLDSRPLWLGLEPGRKTEPFPSARRCGNTKTCQSQERYYQNQVREGGLRPVAIPFAQFDFPTNSYRRLMHGRPNKLTNLAAPKLSAGLSSSG